MKAEDYILKQIEIMRPEWEQAGIINFLERIKNMYLREVEHIRYIKKNSFILNDTNSFFKNLIKKFTLYKEINEFKSYETCVTEEDIAKRAISNVNVVYDSIFLNKAPN